MMDKKLGPHRVLERPGTGTHRALAWLVILAALAAVTQVAAAQNWPQWRGPHRDGAVMAFDEPALWPSILTKQWQVEVGLGYATPLLVGDRIFMYTRQDGDEVMLALDANSGDIIWRSAYPAPFRPNPAATSRHGAGPKSTPVFADGRIFTMGMSGIVTAFDAETGTQLWQIPAPPVQPLYHTATSPLVDDDLVIVHVGGHGDGLAAQGAYRLCRRLDLRLGAGGADDVRARLGQGERHLLAQAASGAGHHCHLAVEAKSLQHHSPALLSRRVDVCEAGVLYTSGR